MTTPAEGYSLRGRRALAAASGTSEGPRRRLRGERRRLVPGREVQAEAGAAGAGEGARTAGPAGGKVVPGLPLCRWKGFGGGGGGAARLVLRLS